MTTRPKEPPAAARTLRVPEDHATLDLADAAARPGDEISLKDGSYPGDVTLDRDHFDPAHPDARVVIRSRTPLGAVFSGQVFAQNGQGYWFYELVFTAQVFSPQASLSVGSFCNVTRCRFEGRNGLVIPNWIRDDSDSPAPKQDINVGWCDFVGRNDASEPSTMLKISKNESPRRPAGQIEFQNINLYRLYFNDISPGNDAVPSHDSLCIYLGNTHLKDGDVPQFPNFNISRCYFSPDCRRKRAIYLKHGITEVRRCRSGLRTQGVAYTQRHGWGTKWYANVAENTVKGSGFIFGGGGTAELFTDVCGNLIQGDGRFRVESGRRNHQAADHIRFVDNSGPLQLGIKKGTLSEEEAERGKIRDAKVFRHTGGFALPDGTAQGDTAPVDTARGNTVPVNKTLVNDASVTIDEDGSPLDFAIPARITLTPDMVGLELAGERSSP